MADGGPTLPSGQHYLKTNTTCGPALIKANTTFGPTLIKANMALAARLGPPRTARITDFFDHCHVHAPVLCRRTVAGSCANLTDWYARHGMGTARRGAWRGAAWARKDMLLMRFQGVDRLWAFVRAYVWAYEQTYVYAYVQAYA